MKVCFFTSTGDDLSLIKYISKNYTYDIIANYYGTSNDTYDVIKNIAKYCVNHKLSKFQSLRKIYDCLDNYDQVIVFDDDAIITYGSIDTLIKIMSKYNLEVISSAHDSSGKISHNIHRQIINNHICRQVNFIEMNFPIFSKYALKKFMSHYDGFLAGWGVDHLYSSLFSNMAICDSVVVLNPKNSNRINKLISLEHRRLQWKKYKEKNNIPENYNHYNIKYYYE